MSHAVALPRARTLVLADLIPGALARDIALVAGGAGLVGALAQIAVHVPGTPVPVTGQTLGVLLIGSAYASSSENVAEPRNSPSTPRRWSTTRRRTCQRPRRKAAAVRWATAPPRGWR